MIFWRRRTSGLLLVASFVLSFFYLKAAFDHSSRHLDEPAHEPIHHSSPHSGRPLGSGDSRSHVDAGDGPKDAAGDASGFSWKTIPVRFPVESMQALPTGKPVKFPKVQHEFGKETAKAHTVRLQRQEAVKTAFLRCWQSYRQQAWGHDELAPISGQAKDPYGGWGATLVDSLDTLWIMDLQEEFEAAISAAMNISFTPSSSHDKINVFETNIRYLGGFLAAYDLSGDDRLLRKAREVGEMLYAAFDTHNRLPIPRLDLVLASTGTAQKWDDASAVAETGSFSLEFIRLSMLTGDPKWFDAAQRVTEAFRAQQQSSTLPGMWPTLVNAHRDKLSRDTTFSLGANADSLYEYLLKTHVLAGGLLPVYREMYETAMTAASEHLLFRPMVTDGSDILFSGVAHSKKSSRKSDSENVWIELDPEVQHLACFAGGMYALGSKVLQLKDHLEIGQKLTDGCIWAYQTAPAGIMPETFSLVPCPSDQTCEWDNEAWMKAVVVKHHPDPPEPPLSEAQLAQRVVKEQMLPEGFTEITDRHYLLRPEAIESVFVLYRITGREDLLDSAWDMFQAINRRTRTKLANAAISDVMFRGKNAMQLDSMESFWMGETLKYFYLVFSEPGLISLDEWVLNTEAHPLRRLLPS